MNQIKETEKAYIAGFFDGEGCVHISKQMRRERVSFEYSLKVVIVNTKLEPLELIQSLFGGTIHKYDKKKNSKWATTYQLQMCPKNALQLLLIIKPYLIIKKPQVEVAIKLNKLRKIYPRVVEHTKFSNGRAMLHCLPSSPEYLGFQEECYQKIKELNKRKNNETR